MDRIAPQQNFVSVYGNVWDGISLRMVGKAGDQSVSREGRKLSIAVVFAHKDDRQFPQAGDIERLVKGACLACTIAEKHHSDLPSSFLLADKHCTQGKRNSAPDNARGGNETALHRNQVHGAAFSPTVTG